MQKIIEDKDFGRVVMQKYRQSRAYTIRAREGNIRISLPYAGTYQAALDLLDKHRTSLLLRLKQYKALPALEYDERDLRTRAHAFLPQRLKELAEMHGFTYEKVRISSSRGRWGSCSSRRHINLSFFLMLLPEHLIDYVILHELCHTREMNHGPAFWQLMDEVTGGKALLLRRELRSRNIPRG